MGVELVAVGAQHGPHAAEPQAAHLGLFGSDQAGTGRQWPRLLQSFMRTMRPSRPRLGASRRGRKSARGPLLAPDLQGPALEG